MKYNARIVFIVALNKSRQFAFFKHRLFSYLPAPSRLSHMWSWIGSLYPMFGRL
jgi:hypothetical protein